MGISWVQIAIIVVIALIFFGPGRLPGLGKSLGEAIRGFKKGITSDDDGEKTIDVTESDKNGRIEENKSKKETT